MTYINLMAASGKPACNMANNQQQTGNSLKTPGSSNMQQWQWRQQAIAANKRLRAKRRL
jgi:hypothetical protein